MLSATASLTFFSEFTYFEMSLVRRIPLCLIIAVVTVSSFTAACAGPTEQANSAQPEQSAEPNPVTAAPTFTPFFAQSSPTPAREFPAESPKPNEVNDAVARVFEKAALPDTSRQPGSVVGDFNGDGSEDLAVLIKPNEGSLSEINNELANWILEDPKNVAIQKTGATPAAPPKRAQAAHGEILLAVIHGAGAQGWRNPEAKQTFLLKNAAADKMNSESINSLRDRKDSQRLPPLRGDAISEGMGGNSGLLYWTGAKYAWYRLTSK